MAAAPEYKVYSPANEYVAACKHLEDAAAIVSSYGDGATIRAGHSKQDIVWTEGKEDKPAGESYDNVRITAVKRMEERAAASAAARAAAPAFFQK